MLAPYALSRTAKDISSSAACIAVLQVSLSVAHQSLPVRAHRPIFRQATLPVSVLMLMANLRNRRSVGGIGVHLSGRGAGVDGHVGQ